MSICQCMYVWINVREYNVQLNPGFSVRGADCPGGGVPTYDFAKLSEKNQPKYYMKS